MKKLLFLLFLAPHLAQAEGFRGISAFSLPNSDFPCDRALAILAHPRFPAISVLWETFGIDYTCLQRFTQAFRHKPHLVQFHLTNEACRRNQRCLDGELFTDLTAPYYSIYLEFFPHLVQQQIIDRTLNIYSFAKTIANQNTYLLLSLGLEDNLTQGAADNLERIVSQVWPWFISRNSVRGSHTSLQGIRETHHPSQTLLPPACIVNEDGNTVTLKTSQALLKKHRGCFAIFLWRHRWQNADEGRSGFIPPRERTFNITAKDVGEIGALLRRNGR